MCKSKFPATYDIPYTYPRSVLKIEKQAKIFFSGWCNNDPFRNTFRSENVLCKSTSITLIFFLNYSSSSIYFSASLTRSNSDSYNF